MGKILFRAGMRSISVGIAALAMGSALDAGGTNAAGPADGLQAERAVISVFGTIHPKIVEFRAPVGSQIPDNPDVRVASLVTGVASEAAAEEDIESEVADSFDERFYFDERIASFDERFAKTGVSPERAPAKAAETKLPALVPDSAAQTARPGNGRRAPQLASLAMPPRASASKKAAPSPEAHEDSLAPPDVDSRTAIYDISAHTVYLPDGRRLEAHSGLGSHMDDPRHVNLRMHGPTPPNVYKLTMREQLFHGVRAIRLNPVDHGKMFGRAGMLAHTYMLGPNGQSNGCVSFSDYPAFLNAFLKGEVERLVVVERMAGAPSTKAASNWFSHAVRNLLKPYERDARI